MTHTSLVFQKKKKKTHIFCFYSFASSLHYLPFSFFNIIILFIFFYLILKAPRKLGKMGCVMACALTGILPTLACNAANNRWGVVSMGWRERRGGRHEVGMGASSWDARLEHGGTIWQGISSIFSRIFTALLSPLPGTKYVSVPGRGS